jgi:hypothetical protein
MVGRGTIIGPRESVADRLLFAGASRQAVRS